MNNLIYVFKFCLCFLVRGFLGFVFGIWFGGVVVFGCVCFYGFIERRMMRRELKCGF